MQNTGIVNCRMGGPLKAAHTETAQGALIAEVVKGGPAEKAGMKKGDVVIGYQGKDIPDSGTLRNDAAETPVSQEVRVTVLRAGKKVELTVKVGSLESSEKLLMTSVNDRIGAEVRPPNTKEVEKYGLDPNQGVVITKVEPKGPLGEAGFEVGDMILAIERAAIMSLIRLPERSWRTGLKPAAKRP